MDNTTSTGTNPKTVALVSYLTIIGWLIAYFAFYQNNKSSLAAYHLRQTLLLYIIGFALGIFQRMMWYMGFFYMISSLIALALLIFWIIGLIAAINGEEKPIPLIGKTAQQWFKGI